MPHIADHTLQDQPWYGGGAHASRNTCRDGHESEAESANDTRRQNCEAMTAEYKVLMMMMSNGQWRERVSPRCTRCGGVDGESEDQFCAA